MKTIPSQILAGTRLDRQGERNSKNVLENYAAAYAGKRLPLNQHHDLSLPVIGYIENLRVIADQTSPDDWHLVGDVFLEGDGVDPKFGGFSFSYMEKLRNSQSQERIEVFLPHPHYNDLSLIDEVFEDGYVSVGKIVRKGASPETVALIVSVAVAVLQPAWEDVFRSKIAPAVTDFFQRRFGSLSTRGISCDYLQHIDYCGHSAQVLFVPLRGMESSCLSIEKLYGGMLMVSDYLNALDVNHVPALKIILAFDKAQGMFAIRAVHFSDGSVKTDG
ncbi:hypothetical protein [Polaromonas sp. UC242_47]|uniref:hypothetical protein n=1 Tax=Polaromonas sp. UC242_47 TaxID=3374626 RepID=UPI00378AB25F